MADRHRPGAVTLHGGGEFLGGDDPTLAAMLAAVRPAVRPARIVIVPTAAARARPDLAAAQGTEAFRRVAAERGVLAQVEELPIVDAESAADATLVASIDRADVIYLPGGDPDLIPAIPPEPPAWAAMLEAWHGGAVLAGASAGAMALAASCWTPGGLVAGLGVVPGLVVAPHADATSWARNVTRFGPQVPAHLGILGIGERTALLGRPGEAWRVVGAGEVRWQAAGATRPVIARHGATIRLDVPGESAVGALSRCSGVPPRHR
ncbi:hypothetical protein BH20CHL7_BH20CHL7_01010 [soil metagenome]